MNNNSTQRHFIPVPHEGDDGLFRQTWHALCRSSDLAAGSVIGRDFLDGRVAIFRGADGQAQVVSAYCPHLGADLSVGCVTGNSLRCAFHHWEFGHDGRCQRTGTGDPAPPHARVFKFPTVERFGVVWAFNGEQPLFDLVDPSRPWDQLVWSTAPAFQLKTDPWIVCCNTPDWSHFATVHRFGYEREGQHETLRFEEFGVRRTFQAQLEFGEGPQIDFEVTVRGTNLVLIEGIIGGQWFGVAASLGLPRPGLCDFFITTMVDRTEDPSEAAATARLQDYIAISKRMAAEDSPIWDTIHFKPGALTKSDRALARYLEQLRKFPRAHPSKDFIN